MSNEKYRLHPVTAFIEAIKSLKNFILPLIIIVFANGFQINFDIRSDEFWEQSFSLIIFTFIFVGVIITGFIKWLTYRYWFEENELRIEYGLFIKKKRYIPFERIQNLNYQESILHRVFGLVQVFVETAGSKTGKAEAELTAITRDAADQVEVEMNKAKRRETALEVKEQPSLQQVHQMPLRDLLIVATTSNSIGVVLAGMAAVVMQFSQYIPFEAIFDELAQFVRFSFIVIAIIVFLLLLIVWLISVLLTAINYYNFTIFKDRERIVITRGLFEKKRITLPINRVQAIRVVENPLRQLFGLCTVVVESAGGNFSGEKDRKIVLLPIISKREMKLLLADIFPAYNFEMVQPIVSPKEGRPFFYRLNFLYIVPIIAALSYFFYPYGLLSFGIIAVSILLGVWQHRTAAYVVDDQQLIICYRIVSRSTFYVHKNRIQILEQRQTYFQKRKHIATANIVVMSGANGSSAKAYNMHLENIVQLMAWYERKK